MKEVYGKYFTKLLTDIDIRLDDTILRGSYEEIIKEGKIEQLTNYVGEILKASDNRILIKFDEKYISLIYFTLLFTNRNFNIYNEYPCKNGYIDILIISNSEINKYNIMIELKYIKVNDYNEKITRRKNERSNNSTKKLLIKQKAK